MNKRLITSLMCFGILSGIGTGALTQVNADDIPTDVEFPPEHITADQIPNSASSNTTSEEQKADVPTVSWWDSKPLSNTNTNKNHHIPTYKTYLTKNSKGKMVIKARVVNKHRARKPIRKHVRRRARKRARRRTRKHMNRYAKRNRRRAMRRYRRPKQLNQYLSRTSFRHHRRGTWEVRVKRTAFIYGSKHYYKRNRDMKVRPGTKLGVAQVIRLSRHVRRLVLNNGQYFTANKKYVRVV